MKISCKHHFLSRSRPFLKSPCFSLSLLPVAQSVILVDVQSVSQKLSRVPVTVCFVFLEFYATTTFSFSYWFICYVGSFPCSNCSAVWVFSHNYGSSKLLMHSGHRCVPSSIMTKPECTSGETVKIKHFKTFVYWTNEYFLRAFSYAIIRSQYSLNVFLTLKRRCAYWDGNF